MTSAIMRRPESAKATNENDQRLSAATRRGTSYSLSQQLARDWAKSLASNVARRALQPTLASLRDVLVNVALLGGAFVVPVATLIAMICAWLPASHPLHHMAPTFFAVASMWFVAALLFSHFQPRDDGEMRRETA